MNKTDFFVKMVDLAEEHATEILTGVGILAYTASIGTTVLATKRTIDEINKKDIKNPKPKDYIREGWKYFVLPALGYTIGTTCVITSDVKQNKKYAALAAGFTAYSATESIYRDKVKALLGEEKEKEVRHDSICESNDFKKAPEQVKESIKDGETVLFYEPYTNQLLYSTIDKVKLASVQLSNQIIQYGWANMNTFCTLMGAKCTTSGNLHGWDDRDPKIELYFDTELIDDRPVIVIGYRTEPLPINELR